MDVVMSAFDLAGWQHGTKHPQKAWVMTVNRQCTSGDIKHAQKIGNKWFVNCSKEWPMLFPPEEREDPINAFAELLEEMADALKKKTAAATAVSDEKAKESYHETE